MTDAQIDGKLDAACDATYPGSRNIRGLELEGGAYASIAGLPAVPHWPFAPSCPGCGNTCDAGGGRLCGAIVFGSGTPDWDTSKGNAGGWYENHGGSVLTAECIHDLCSPS
jgi:hypothetical protein